MDLTLWFASYEPAELAEFETRQDELAIVSCEPLENYHVQVCPAHDTYPIFAPLFYSEPSTPPHRPLFHECSGVSTTHIEVENLDLANLHILVDPEGKQVADLVFTSEAPSMPAADGYGWAQFEFGYRYGHDNRHSIVRKLGWGMRSSTWLPRDSLSVYRYLSHCWVRH